MVAPTARRFPPGGGRHTAIPIRTKAAPLESEQGRSGRQDAGRPRRWRCRADRSAADGSDTNFSAASLHAFVEASKPARSPRSTAGPVTPAPPAIRMSSGRWPRTSSYRERIASSPIWRLALGVKHLRSYLNKSFFRLYERRGRQVVSSMLRGHRTTAYGLSRRPDGPPGFAEERVGRRPICSDGDGRSCGSGSAQPAGDNSSRFNVLFPASGRTGIEVTQASRVASTGS
jgi:hypothetical protein